MTESIWFKDPHAFVDQAYLGRFFPVKQMSLEEQLNAVLRFTIYFALVLLIAGRGSHILFLPIATAAGTYIMYMASSNGQESKIQGQEPLTQQGVQQNEGYADEEQRQAVASQKRCVAPTRDNPFMNVLTTDYITRPNRGEACDIQKPCVAARAEKMFDSAGTGLVRDSDDVFHRNTSSRQFVTNPSTSIPNDQSSFASWLYGGEPTCKGNDRSGCKYRT